MSRPLKLTPKVQQRIVAAVAGGATLVEVAAKVGVDEWTLHDWRRRFPQFSQSIANAQAQALKRRVTETMSASAAARLDEARTKFDQLQVALSGFRAGRAAKELEASLSVSRVTAWKLRDVLGLVEPRTRAAALQCAESVLRLASSLIAAYADGFQVPVGDPRFGLAAFLGLETGRRWTAGAVRTGRHATKQALAEVRP